jgi:2-polyprenyl-3-methyl-5-hydroxy-6-metoxy-1,4-benzoquinol methylase
MPTIADVRNYWNSNPLFSHELKEVGSPAFFDQLHEIKTSDVERYALPFWQFDAYAGRRVLDVGCGPGWITVQYARHGALMDSVDLTPRAVELTNAHLAYRGLSATVQVGNAEELPFANETFDVVVSSGVLHHTPNTSKSFAECHRVLKSGGHAKITLYRKGLLHTPFVFGLTRLAMRVLGVKHPGADLSRDAKDVDDFIRQYDGADNPVGIAYSDSDWRRLLEKAGFKYLRHEVHFFPRRFIPASALIPGFVHKLLDSKLGTMVYFDLQKPR